MNDRELAVKTPVGVKYFIAGGETKWNPRIEIEQVFQAACEAVEQSDAAAIAAIVTSLIYNSLSKSVEKDEHQKKSSKLSLNIFV